MAVGNAVVVEPHQRDDVFDVGLVLDPARPRPLLAGEHRVIDDSTLLLEGRPRLLLEEEVGGVVAVQVTDLPPTDLEGELAAAARASLDARPRGDLLRDPLARRWLLAHGASSGVWTDSRPIYKFK